MLFFFSSVISLISCDVVDFDLLPVVSKPDDKRNPDELHAGEKFGVSFLVVIFITSLFLFSTYSYDFFFQ